MEWHGKSKLAAKIFTLYTFYTVKVVKMNVPVQSAGGWLTTAPPNHRTI